MNDVISKMPVEKILMENLYFYNHQINKIQFLMRISQNSFNFLSKLRCSKLGLPILQI